MRAKTTAAILTLSALAALGLPTLAAAATHHYREKASVTAELQARGTHGFEVELSNLGEGSYMLRATKSVSKLAMEVASYFSMSQGERAPFDGTLDVKIGPLGHFRGRFVPTKSKTEKPRRGCTGEPTLTATGYFVGSFDFRGERGYTVVHARRVPGSVTHHGAVRCKAPAAPRGHRSPRQAKRERELEEREFRLIAGDSNSDVLLMADLVGVPKKFSTHPAVFMASATSGRPSSFFVNRTAVVFDVGPNAASAFQVPNLAEPLAEATLQPPAPFSGSATFHLDGPHSASWTGALAVELPGVGKVPLTGGGIGAGLCQGRSHCTKTLPAALQPFLEENILGGAFTAAVAIQLVSASSPN
ncbi:MAG: hypothetical protein JSU06_03820 [Actinobacteria bacterium]|nr:hypothetical protein [Actinomycetota bacterium]